MFCKNNGEDESFYLNHTLKDDLGRVTCPILSAYTCPICGATGSVAHTIKYCPRNKVSRTSCFQLIPRDLPVFSLQELDSESGEPLSREASITQLKQMRSSTGRPRPIVNAPVPVSGPANMRQQQPPQIGSGGPASMWQQSQMRPPTRMMLPPIGTPPQSAEENNGGGCGRRFLYN